MAVNLQGLLGLLGQMRTTQEGQKQNMANTLARFGMDTQQGLRRQGMQDKDIGWQRARQSNDLTFRRSENQADRRQRQSLSDDQNQRGPLMALMRNPALMQNPKMLAVVARGLGLDPASPQFAAQREAILNRIGEMPSTASPVAEPEPLMTYGKFVDTYGKDATPDLWEKIQSGTPLPGGLKTVTERGREKSGALRQKQIDLMGTRIEQSALQFHKSRTDKLNEAAQRQLAEAVKAKNAAAVATARKLKSQIGIVGSRINQLIRERGSLEKSVAMASEFGRDNANAQRRLDEVVEELQARQNEFDTLYREFGAAPVAGDQAADAFDDISEAAVETFGTPGG